MKIFVADYELKPRGSLGALAGGAPRKGALLRVELGRLAPGYADCHPWPELGHPTLSTQLGLLSRGELTDVTRRSLLLARRDAELRDRGASGFAGLEIPESHALVTDLVALAAHDAAAWDALVARGFRLAKIKVGRAPAVELAALRAIPASALRLRLDFNQALSFDEVRRFLAGLGPTLARIDFVEDPCAYDPAHWRALKREFGVRLAVDRLPAPTGLESDTADVLVIKPAFQSPEACASLARELDWSVVVTSALDHPLGVLGAAWEAARLARTVPLEACGLLSSVAYEDDAFSRELETDGPRLLAPRGPGLGLTSELERLDWKPL